MGAWTRAQLATRQVRVANYAGSLHVFVDQ